MGFEMNNSIAIFVMFLVAFVAALFVTDFYIMIYIFYFVDLTIGFGIGGSTRKLKSNFFKSMLYMHLFFVFTAIFIISCYFYFEHDFKGFYYLLAP